MSAKVVSRVGLNYSGDFILIWFIIFAHKFKKKHSLRDFCILYYPAYEDRKLHFYSLTLKLVSFQFNCDEKNLLVQIIPFCMMF